MFKLNDKLHILIQEFVINIMEKIYYKKVFNDDDIKENSKILDFGCGIKNYTSHLLCEYSSIEITNVVDSNEKKHFLKTNRNNKRNEYINLTDFLISNRKENYDLIFSYFSLKNLSIDNLRYITTYLANTLRDGGTLVIRESLEDVDIYKKIKEVLAFSNLSLVKNHIFEIPYVGNVIELKYKKKLEI